MHEKWVHSIINGFDINMMVKRSAIGIVYDLPGNQHRHSDSLWVGLGWIMAALVSCWILNGNHNWKTISMALHTFNPHFDVKTIEIWVSPFFMHYFFLQQVWNTQLTRVLYMSFDKFILAVELCDLSQADKSNSIRVHTAPWGWQKSSALLLSVLT